MPEQAAAVPLEAAVSSFELLQQPLDISAPPESVYFAPNPAYDSYLRMHKVLVGKHGAECLERIYADLREESLPRFLSAAGWAATEAALIQYDKPNEHRLGLLNGAWDCWSRALAYQRELNTSGLDALVEHSYPYRIALDMAVLPLLAGVVEGNISMNLRRRVNQECLNIAQANAVQINLAARNGEADALGDHLGLGYECNALLAFNMRFMRGWFVIPSLARSDTGYHHPHQTHDLLVVHHRAGSVVNATPVEVKSAASSRDRQRYKALLVRGKMHLSVSGKYTPEETLAAIEAVYEDRATAQEQAVFDQISDRFVDMVRDYGAGEFLGHLASSRSVTRFRDNTKVVSKYPGLAVAGS